MQSLILLLSLACNLPVETRTVDTATEDVSDGGACTADTVWFSVQDPTGSYSEGVLDVTVDVANLGEDFYGYPGVILTIDQPYDVEEQEWWWYGMDAGQVDTAPFTVDLQGFPEDALDEVLLTFEVAALSCSQENPEACIEGCTLSCSVDVLLTGTCPIGTP